jgi:hypothetical protein
MHMRGFPGIQNYTDGKGLRTCKSMQIGLFSDMQQYDDFGDLQLCNSMEEERGSQGMQGFLSK